ncbi:MAG: FtsW/RodA/SpoVE family cell cycle protein [Longimicrobiaceae bacterium]
MTGLLDRLFGRRGGPSGVEIRLRAHNRPRHERKGGIPPLLLWGLFLAVGFYLLAHLSVVEGVWPIHGTAPGAGRLLLRDLVSLGAWLLVPLVLRWRGYRGNWAVVILPILVFLLARPALFQVFSDPVYQATDETRAEANQAKAERSRLSTIARAYDQERQQEVFGGEPPELPNPLERAAYQALEEGPRGAAQLASYGSPILAPIVLLLAFAWARRRERLRFFRDRRRIPFALTMGLFFLLALFFTERGKVLGTTPWELFLPIFVGVWAAVLADDAYNLARPGAAFERRRIVNLLVYGALPVIPFILIRELGLSVVLAGTLAVMLLVGTRRGWWAALLLAIWAVLVTSAFSVDERSQSRFRLAYDLYGDTAMTVEEREARSAGVYQIKLFDANLLAGGVVGPGPGRGHGETAPNAADDGFITLFAAQYGWLGALVLVLLYTLFTVRMLGVAVRERGAFERSAATGLAMLLAIPFWLSVLGGVRVIPLTGVVAAFAGHGGTKLLASSLAVGVVAAISHRRTLEPEPDEGPPGSTAHVPGEGVRIR